MSWISEVCFNKDNFLNVLDGVKMKCSKRSSRKNCSLVKLKDFNTELGINLYINWNFFLGHHIPDYIIEKFELMHPEINIKSVVSCENKLRKEWNSDIKCFVICIDEFDIYNIIQYSTTIQNTSELYELFFVTNVDVHVMLGKYVDMNEKYKNMQEKCESLQEKYQSVCDEINEMKDNNDLELTKIETVVNDFKKDNKYLVGILDEMEREIQSLNEKNALLQREHDCTLEKLFQCEQDQKKCESEKTKNEKEIEVQANDNMCAILNNNDALKKEIKNLESQKRDLLSENEKLYERLTNKSLFWFC